MFLCVLICLCKIASPNYLIILYLYVTIDKNKFAVKTFKFGLHSLPPPHPLAARHRSGRKHLLKIWIVKLEKDLSCFVRAVSKGYFLFYLLLSKASLVLPLRYRKYLKLSSDPIQMSSSSASVAFRENGNKIQEALSLQLVCGSHKRGGLAACRYELSEQALLPGSSATIKKPSSKLIGKVVRHSRCEGVGEGGWDFRNQSPKAVYIPECT